MASHYISADDERAAVIKLVITAILGLLQLPLILTSLLLDRSMQRDDGVPFHSQTNSHNISVHYSSKVTQYMATRPAGVATPEI